jgi:putative transposase
MSTARFCQLLDIPERTWRRKQAKARTAGFSSGPWPRPARNRSRQVVVDLARRHPAWGHRKIWAMARHDGHQLTMSTVLRILRDEGLLLQTSYQRDRRRLAAERKAAFCDPPTRPNQVWQFDFSEYETSSGGTWRTAGVADYWSKYEFGWHWSATANQHDAVAGVELAIAEATRLLGASLLETFTDAQTGEITPLVLVTDNGGPFRSFRFARFITAHPELRHVRTRVKTPGQNGVRERAFESLKYERLYREDISNILDLTSHAEQFRVEFNTIRPHEALSWNRPLAVHLGHASPTIPIFDQAEILPLS